ncbi:hypothetical protein MLD38_003123 [Melastoma candidum]|uniref:Uncharacterized protein n=1 Tax=Melastoma candidum TaxID=119954 RepID=A0ACB9S4R0_9MYRT|nr:hypothetical protein MLD38_003123 [Melastoma candidum]
MLPFSADHGGQFDRSLWEAYISANNLFSQRVIEVLNPDEDYIWIHDYNLMVLPTFLMRLFNRVRMGLFLHCPFPLSEIYRTLPVRDEILKGLLNADVIGFHTFDYARHFLSCCSRMLGLEYQSKRGYIGLEYYGRTIGMKIMPVGVHMGRRIASVMRPAYEEHTLAEIAHQFEGKIVLLGVDDLDIFKVTAVRDGMNLIRYEYVVCRQGFNGSNLNASHAERKKSMLIISEVIGYSPSLSGAIRINPWNVEDTAEALNEAIGTDMGRICVDHFRKRCWGIGFGFGFRVVALDPNFRKLSRAMLVSNYNRARTRAILLDYDGTVKSQNSTIKSPSKEVLAILNTLCADKRNTVFMVSGRSRDTLTEWFSSCPSLGIAAKHGYFLRWSQDEEWKICGQSSDFGWMQIAEPVMKLYTEATDGWFLNRAKELLDHLESVLANEPAAVKSGQFIIEVKPQGISKGLVAEQIFSTMAGKGKRADFVLCIGDDRSDEDMFESIENALSKSMLAANAAVFTCTKSRSQAKRDTT